jgi:hypothetical protein
MKLDLKVVDMDYIHVLSCKKEFHNQKRVFPQAECTVLLLL